MDIASSGAGVGLLKLSAIVTSWCQLELCKPPLRRVHGCAEARRAPALQAHVRVCILRPSVDAVPAGRAGVTDTMAVFV